MYTTLSGWDLFHTKRSIGSRPNILHSYEFGFTDQGTFIFRGNPNKILNTKKKWCTTSSSHKYDLRLLLISMSTFLKFLILIFFLRKLYPELSVTCGTLLLLNIRILEWILHRLWKSIGNLIASELDRFILSSPQNSSLCLNSLRSSTTLANFLSAWNSLKDVILLIERIFGKGGYIDILRSSTNKTSWFLHRNFATE